MDELTHLDERGRARMVDVTGKEPTRREATAIGSVRMRAATLERIVEGTIGKGEVLAVARVAAIQAAKRTPDLVPLCHPLPLTGVEVELEPDPDLPGVGIRVTARCHGPTGVEMEALTGATAAGLTIYDMCKAIDRGMSIGPFELVAKSGGRSGTWTRAGADASPTTE